MLHSDKLLNASAVIEIAPVMIPAKNFVANRKILQQIPTIPAIFPYAFLTLLSFIFSLSLINSDINKFVIKNSIYSANGSPKDPQCVFLYVYEDLLPHIFLYASTILPAIADAAAVFGDPK